MTMLEIGIAAAIKGALIVFLVKKGWWPDWEKRAAERAEEKRVLLAYKEWRKNRAAQPGAYPATDAGIVDQPVASNSERLGSSS